jgi:Pectate lyase superfamily protein
MKMKVGGMQGRLRTYDDILPTLGLMRGGVSTPSRKKRLGARPPRLICAALVVISLILVACTDSDTETSEPEATTVTTGQQPTGATTTSPPEPIELPSLPSPEVVFPDDSGVVNVVEDYGARGDGVTDDTEAIRRAIEENVGRSRILYFPAGTYLVSNSLEWRDGEADWQPFLTFQGQGRDLTVIQLADGSEGFGDPAQPRGVVVTGSGLFNGEATAGGKDYEGLGEGNEAFRNYVFDLTVNTGSDNPGAVGVDLMANNNGGLRNVTIRSGDGRGVAGIGMTRRWPGPALIKNVRVEGFDYGVAVAHTEYGLTFENLVLVDQVVAGIHNEGNVLSIRSLTSRNSVPAIQNVSEVGLIVLMGSTLGGGSPEVSAIENEGHLYARDLVTEGYQSAIAGIEGQSVDEYASASLSQDLPLTLGLPIEETPVQEWAEPSEWSSVTDPAYAGGANPADEEDDTAAIQAALDSGRSIVYFPSSGPLAEGRYLISDTLVVPPHVERIIGLESWVSPSADNQFQDESNPRPLFSFQGGESGQVVSLEQFRFIRYEADFPGAIWIQGDSPRTLVIQNVTLGGGDLVGYRGLPDSGPLFLEDFCCSNMQLDNTQGVWARQLNPERSNKTKVENAGTNLWILGIKTENPTVVIETTESGRTELLGGLLYPVDEVPADLPAFVSIDAKHSLIYAVSAHGSATRNHVIQVEETTGGVTEQLLTEQAPSRNLGSVVTR